jgi:hypothetical protein
MSDNHAFLEEPKWIPAASGKWGVCVPFSGFGLLFLPNKIAQVQGVTPFVDTVKQINREIVNWLV